MTTSQIDWTLILIGGCYLLPSILFLLISLIIHINHRRTHTVYYCDNFGCKRYAECEHGLNAGLKKTMKEFYYFRELKIDMLEVEENNCNQFKEPK